MSDTQRVGLVLGGGGARGLGHIPVLMAMEELGLVPVAIAGTSIGGLVGAAYGSGMRGQDLHDYFQQTFGKISTVIAKLWDTRPTSFSELRSRGIRFSQFNIEEILRSFLPKDICENFEDLAMPLSVVAADIQSGEMVVLRDGDLRSAIAGSASMPGVFAPVHRGDHLLVDGGICNPVPLDCLGVDVDTVIAVDVIGFESNAFSERTPTVLQSLYAANMIAQRALTVAHFDKYPPDLLLTPPVSGIWVLDFVKSRKILDKVLPYKEEAKRAIANIMENKAIAV